MVLTVDDILKIKEALRSEFDSIHNKLDGVKDDMGGIKIDVAQLKDDVISIRKDINEIRTLLGSQVERNTKGIKLIKGHLNLQTA